MSSPLEPTRPPRRGGRFDFEGYELSHDLVGEPLITQHEREHSGFVRGTIYGQAQNIAEVLYRESRNSDVARFKWTLLQASIQTHERGATYCSVKLFPEAEQGRLYDLLPPPYQAAYSDVAQVVDNAFRSSYTQYVVGKALINGALNPPIHELLSHAQWRNQLGEFRVPGKFSPDERWNHIIEAIRQTGVATFARQVVETAEAGLASEGLALPGPVDAEETWLSLTASVGMRLDSWLFSAVEDALHLSAPQVLIVNSDGFDAAQAAVAEAVGRAVGRPMQAARGEWSPQEPADLRAEITNADVPMLEELPQLHTAAVHSWFESGAGPRYVVSAYDAVDLRGSDWVIGSAAGESMAVARASTDDLVGALRRRAHWATLGSPVVDVRLMVRINGHDRLAAAYDLVAPLFAVPLDHQVLDLGSDELHWYMAGDLGDWWRELLTYGPLQMLPILDTPTEVLPEIRPVATWDEVVLPSPDTVRLGDAHGEPGGTALVMCKAERLIGTFIRAIIGSALGTVMKLTGDDFELWPLDDRRRRYEQSLTLARFALAVWPRL